MESGEGRAAPAILAAGAAAGGLATILMSCVMVAARRAGLMGEMPPEKITARLLDRLGWGSRSPQAQDALATVAHIGFGAAGGSIFSVLRSGLRLPGPPILAGTAFGAAVWFVSYQGWVPALGIMPPPSRDRPGRPQAMLLAHLVYGAALGALVAGPGTHRAASRRRPPASD